MDIFAEGLEKGASYKGYSFFFFLETNLPQICVQTKGNPCGTLVVGREVGASHERGAGRDWEPTEGRGKRAVHNERVSQGRHSLERVGTAAAAQRAGCLHR